MLSINEKRMGFWEHLDELLSRLRVILVTVIVSGLLIGFWPADVRGFLDPTGLYQPIISVIMLRMRHDLLPAGATLIAGGLTDTLYVYMFLSLLIGIVVSSPIVGYELYAFLASALYPWERRNISRFVASFFGLFAFGVGMAYFLILPLTFKILVWFISSGGAAPFINIQDFYNMIITLILATGAFYTAPIFVILLVHVRILPSAFIAGKRKIMYLAFLVILTIITPDPTPLTAIIIMIPFMVIFEAAVLAARRVEKQKVAT